MKKHQLAEKLQFFQDYSKWLILTKVQRETLCKIPIIGDFDGWTSEGWKNRKYLLDFGLIGMDGCRIDSSFC